MAKNERKNTASPGGTCGAEALMQIAITVKTHDREDLEADAAQRVHGLVRGCSRRTARRSMGGRAASQTRGVSRDAPRPAPSRASRRAPAPSGANISSISASVMIIGGQKASVSPIARPITPRASSSAAAAARPCPAPRSPWRPAGASSSAAHQPEVRAPRRPADAREPVEVRREARRQRAHPRRRVHPLVDLQRLHPHRAGDRMPAVGVAVAEACRSCPSSPRSPRPSRASIATADSGRKPAVSCLAIEIEFGSKPSACAPNHCAGPAEAADHLVGDHQHVVPAADRGRSPRSSPRGGTMTPPAPITGSAMKAATVSGPSASISASSSAASRAANAASLSPGSAPFQWCGVADVPDARHRQVEVAVVVRQPGQRGRDDGHAVVGLLPG